MDAVLQLAESLMASPWLYLLVIGLATFDGIVPIVPSETVIIAAGAYAVTGQPHALGLFAAAWAGALIGDVTAHHLGRGAGPIARWFRGRRWGGAMLGWAERELAQRGGMLLISARFIPGGRTATTLASGIVGYPRRRFVGFAAIAAALWSLYSVGIGMLGGAVFQEQPLVGVGAGIGLAIALGGGIELGRTVRRRARERAQKRTRARVSPRSSAVRAVCPAPAPDAT